MSIEGFKLMQYQNHVNAITLAYMKSMEDALDRLREDYEKRGMLPEMPYSEKVELDDADKAIRGKG